MNEVRVLTKPYNRLPYELQRYTIRLFIQT